MNTRRAFDILFTIPGIVLLAPLLLAIAAWIKLTRAAPILFRQQRVGRGGKPFTILKFRTMVADAERCGGQLTVGGDPRITRAGSVLRKCKLDELPQLFNVLRGEMRLVGPRPEVLRYVALYMPAQRAVLELVPGITDPASIRFRNESELLAASACPEETYIREIMPEKIRINLEYSHRSGVVADVRVIMQTLAGLFRS